MKYLNELGDMYSYLLMEDLQTSINQAKNILTSNGFEDVDNYVAAIERIWNDVRLDSPEHRVAKKDSHIPAMAMWLIGNNQSLIRLSDDYRQYVNTRSLYQNNDLGKVMDDLRQTITSRKLFKPSPEKFALIRNKFNEFASKIHSTYEPPAPKDEQGKPSKFDRGSQDENVVFENENVIVYVADSKDKCIKYGHNTRLCIAHRGGGNYFWQYRLGNMRDDELGMTTYFVVFKNRHYSNGDNVMILIDSLGDAEGPANKFSWNPIFNEDGVSTARANEDEDIEAIDLIDKYPELQEPFSNWAFKFIPYGKKEEKYANFSERTDHIIYSDRLGDVYINGRITDGDDLEVAAESGWSIPYRDADRIWKRLAQKFPNNVASAMKKFAMYSDDWDHYANRLNLKVMQKYLPNNDILDYVEHFAEIEGVEAISQIMSPENEKLESYLGDNLLAGLFKRMPIPMTRFLARERPDERNIFTPKLAKILIPHIKNYLFELIDNPTYGYPYDHPVDGVGVIPEELWQEILKKPNLAAWVFVLMFRYMYNRYDEHMEVPYDPENPRADIALGTKVNKRYYEILNSIKKSPKAIKYVKDKNFPVKENLGDVKEHTMKSFEQFFLEYRHDYADGTPSQSIRPNNSKNPDRIGPDKKYLHTVGPYQRENPKMKVPGSILTAQELAEMDIIYDHGKILNNWKNSGFGLEMTSINGEPVARVFKSKPKLPEIETPHLSITK